MKDYLISSGNTTLDREEIIDFLSKIFGTRYTESRTVQETMFDAEPSISPANFIFARSTHGALVGLVRIVERDILVDGAVLTAGCISSVAVKPEWRGKGIATALMNKALETMTARGMDISAVYGRRAVDGFYTRFGYYGVGKYVDLEIISDTESDSSIITSLCKKEYMEACMNLYDETYRSLSGSVSRNRPLWEYLFLRLEKNIGGFRAYVCLEQQKAAGYFIVLNNRLIEISVTQNLYPSMPALLKKMNVESISIHPRHPFSIYCRTQMNTIQQERFALDGGYMASILNPGALLKKLGPVFAVRASVLRAFDNSIIVMNHKVNLSDGEVSAIAGTNDVAFRRPETAIQLFLGVIRPEDIVGIEWSGQKPWIPYLFPELHYHTSAWDEV
ncbi:MAG: hypothetical protein AMK71_11200 [Nitrospira bacterium SG8_35_4]|nr:MAG: hypothetical protein AMK71_11200 [Nitrospira bacterium SG8_35_4]